MPTSVAKRATTNQGSVRPRIVEEGVACYAPTRTQPRRMLALDTDPFAKCGGEVGIKRCRVRLLRE